MALSTKLIVDVTNCKLENEPSFSSANIAFLTAAAGVKTAPILNKVSSFALLPVASENTGRFILVEDETTYYFSNGFEWSVDFSTTTLGSEVWTWGCNGYGRLGDGSTTNRSSPGTTAGGSTNWCQVSGGGNHTAAVKTDGTLWTWGRAGYGRLGDGSTTNRSSPGTTAGGGTDWCQVSAGDTHTAAVKTNGTLWTWGDNYSGRLGTGNTTNRSSPGTTEGGGADWCQVSAGGHTAAVKTNGTLWTWGCNGSGQLGTGNTTSRSSPGTTAGGGTDWSQVSAGCIHTVAVKTNGTLWTWGFNACGQLGDGTTTNRNSPVTTAGGGTNWCQASAGIRFTTAIKTDGTLWTWGCNGSGQLGTGNTTSRSSPGTTAGGGTDWCQVSAGGNHTAAVKTNGTLWTWGLNTCGQLGTGNTTNRTSPGTTAGGGTDWCQVSADAHTAAIRTIIRQGFLQQGF
jgi:alpha-tubulin suppressor-like RCC1 family protein